MNKHPLNNGSVEDEGREDIDSLEELISIKVIFGIAFIFILAFCLSAFDWLRGVLVGRHSSKSND